MPVHTDGVELPKRLRSSLLTKEMGRHGEGQLGLVHVCVALDPQGEMWVFREDPCHVEQGRPGRVGERGTSGFKGDRCLELDFLNYAEGGPAMALAARPSRV